MTLDSPVSRTLVNLGKKLVLLLSVRLRLLLLCIGDLLSSCFLLRDGVVASISSPSREAVLALSVLLRRLESEAL